MSPRTSQQNQQIRAQRKQQILDAALELFAQTGYAATTIDQIAKKAGVSKGLVYNYFESKHDLLLGIFNSLMEDTADMWQVDNTASAKSQLKQLLDHAFLFLDTHHQLSKLMIQLSLQQEVIGDLKEMVSGAVTAKLKIMEPLFEKLDYDDPKSETFFLGSMLDGVSLGRLSLRDDYPFQAVKNKIYKHYNLI